MTSEYPPPHHLTRDLRLRIERVDGRSVASMPIVPEVLDASGGVGVGPLATLVDMVAGSLAMEAAQPGWLATLDLSLHLARPLTGKTVEASGTVLRAGRQTVALEVMLASDASGDAGLAQMTFAVLPRREGTPVFDREFAASVDFALPGSGLKEPFESALGIRVVDAAAGVAQIELAPYVTNSLSALQGGAVATLIDVAGRACASAALGRPACTRDFTLRYLALGKRAPIRATSRLVRRDTSGCLARVEVRESGAEARLCYLGLAAFA